MASILDQQPCMPVYPPQTSARHSADLTATESKKRASLISPLALGIRALLTKGKTNGTLNSDNEDCLRRLLTLIHLADLDSLETLQGVEMSIEDKEKHAELVAPFVVGIKSIRTKGEENGSLSSEEIDFLLRLNTLVQIADLESLQNLPALHRIMRPEWLS